MGLHNNMSPTLPVPNGGEEKVFLGMKPERAAIRGSLSCLVNVSESGGNQFPPLGYAIFARCKNIRGQIYFLFIMRTLVPIRGSCRGPSAFLMLEPVRDSWCLGLVWSRCVTWSKDERTTTACSPFDHCTESSFYTLLHTCLSKMSFSLFPPMFIRDGGGGGCKTRRALRNV